MYFLTDLEQKLLVSRLLPMARRVGVSEDLRGWNWHKEPMKPLYDDVRIPMHLICSHYCPTSRDVYLNRIEGKRGEINYPVSQGLGIHKTVATVITHFLDGDLPEFESWWSEARGKISNPSWIVTMRPRIKMVWDYTLSNCHAALQNRRAEQPYASAHDSMATAIPFLVEHRLNGKLLGLSGLLSIDCYDYLRSISFDLKTGEKPADWHRIYPTGYGLVIESIYEIPVDIGCLVYVNFIDDRLVVQKDLFVINDDLRSWWLEERDRKLEIVAQKVDPGVPHQCPEACIYYGECH